MRLNSLFKNKMYCICLLIPRENVFFYFSLVSCSSRINNCKTYNFDFKNQLIISDTGFGILENHSINHHVYRITDTKYYYLEKKTTLYYTLFRDVHKILT